MVPLKVESVQTFITKLGEDLKVFVDFHAYSQLWLTPWGWTADLPPRADYDAQQVGDAACLCILQCARESKPLLCG